MYSGDIVKSAFRDGRCQTDDVALVSHYPANLLFAQAPRILLALEFTGSKE